MTGVASAVPFGIPNIGATCWLSSLLQMLLSSSYVCQLIQFLPANRGHLTDGLKQLPHSVHLVYAMIQRKLESFGQQDPCEGLLLLLDIWHQEHSIAFDHTKDSFQSSHQRDMIKQILSHSQNTISPIHKLFQGVLEWKDSDQKYRFEPFFTLFCDLQSVPREPTVPLSVKGLIKESLCRKKIIYFPPILLFCVEKEPNRVFAQDTYDICHEFTIRKINDVIVYRLRGLCLHVGGISFGHYTAMRSSEQGIWYLADDHNITPLHEPPSVLSQVPRLMLFERVS